MAGADDVNLEEWYHAIISLQDVKLFTTFYTYP
jgi:hypothetical protein